MADTPAGGTPGAQVDILALGIDTAGLRTGATQVDQALDAVEASAKQAAAAFDAFQASVDDAAVAAKDGATAARGLEAATEEAAGAAKAATTATKGAGAAQVDLTKQQQQGAAAAKAEAAEIKALEASLASTRSAMLAMGATIDEMKKGMAAAQAQIAAMTAAHNSSGTAAKGAAGAYGLTTRELQMLAPQLNDIFTQLSLGQGVMMTAMSQGPQIVQGFNGVGNTLTALGRVAASVFTGVTGLVAAAVAIPAVLLIAYNSMESRLSDLRAGLRGVTTDYVKAAQEIDAASGRIARSGIGVSRADANAVQTSLRRTAPEGSSFDFEAMTRDAADFARVLGTDVPEAADRLGRAMRDPGALVKELAEKNFPGMTGELRRTAEAMANAGDRAGAYDLVLGRIRQSVTGAAADVSPLTLATRGLSTAWAEFTNMVVPWLATGGKLFLDFLTTAASLAGSLGGALLRIPGGVEQLGRAATNSGVSTFGDGDLDRFEQTLIRRESAGRPDQVNQFGYSGLYQFGTAALQASRSYTPSPGENLSRNEWTGTFNIPSFPQVRTQADFLANPAAQREAFRQHTNLLNDGLDNVDGSENFNRVGLLGIAHGYGPGAAAEFVRNGGTSNRTDGNGVRLDATYQAFVTAATGAVTAAEGAIRTTAGTAGGTSGGAVTAANPVSERAFRIVNGEEGRVDALASPASNRAQIERNQGVLNQALALPGNTPQATEAFTRALEAQRVAYEGTMTAAERLSRSEQERTRILQVQDPVQRELAEAVQQYRDAQRSAGLPATAAGEEQAQADRLARLSTEYTSATTAARLQAESSARVAAAYATGAAAGQRAELQERSMQAVRMSGTQGTLAQRAAAEALTRENLKLAQSQSDIASTKSAEANEREVAFLQRSTELIGATANERERELAALRERQRILSANPNADLGSAASQTAISGAMDAATARLDFSRQQAAFNELGRIGEQAFDRIGSAITTAYANGTLSTLKFSDISKAVMSEILQGMLKLAVLNPLKNMFAGGNNPTLLGGSGSVSSVLGLGGGSGGTPITDASGNVTGYIGNASSMQTISGGLSGVNPGAMMSGAYNFNTGISGVDGVLNTPLWGATGAEATNAALGGMGAGVAGPATPGAVSGAAGGTIGSVGAGAVGIAGGLYGIYSGIQKGGVGGGFGVAGGVAATGLSAAAMAGMAVPVYGWIAAAVLTIIGALLPGQKASGKGQETRVDLASGSLEHNGLTGDRYSAGNASQSEAAAQSIASLAAQLGTALGGIKLGGEVAVGVTQSRGDDDIGKLYLDVNGQKGEFGNDEEGAKALAAQASKYLLEQFKTLATGDYAGILNGSGNDVETLQANLTWYDSVYKSFQSGGVAANAYQQALDAVNASYATNIAKAQELSLATDQITAARDKDLAKLEEQRNGQLQGFETGLTIRGIQATGGDSTAAQQAAGLMQFDAQAKQQLIDAKATLEGWGLSAADVSSRVAWNEQVLAEERLAIQKQYGDQTLQLAQQQADEYGRTQAEIAAAQQGAGQALSVVTSLHDYVGSLSTSDASAGTVMDRLDAASRQFNAVSGAALAGDANSISGLQGAAETYRTLARDAFGGGQGYADAIRVITDRIAGVTNLGGAAITQSFVAENARQNTDRVVDAIAELKAETAALSSEIKQIIAMPRAA